MTTTLIIDHPWKESFNHEMLNRLIAGLEQDQKIYQVIDLNKDGFNPVMKAEELAVYQQGSVLDPLVLHYMSLLRETTQLVLIFPVWWYSSPASLKGFLDKVLLNEFAFFDGGNGIQPLLTIDSVVVFTTSDQSMESLEQHCTRSYKHQLTTTLTDIGMRNISWHHLGSVKKLSIEERQSYLATVYEKL
ncbi:NAD(P)H-dependent oxidoreductase [Enterococcus dongliensis]|uniref:NAD(P)H-dependent oxidoreductase n=1 Tax=Enterococcus dongliensis TaxID=2559925 RepID=UPI00288D527B|nr:NAD(P)H-dependent oxidoreductase [Enterococcus dongliensis]MDT2604318.1 NAD(P)H-dependent oxidoreductase [Enterococcus dongliensis]MDT2645599.1 NAD(P)H-dependent oxidoreductase [Enterococcus dongliensis]MDT2669355.1 NAD(P)H-dependent oxidoreductase [Enterococcus dongliensis]MDT2672077.1 NAD(P)H-dependent oxidoreductase [Enterococcus dongliensis]MDT2677495.1 NAD(P)H-dependent oxidoreductase [Enterococcus dongliensis]